MYTPKKIYNSLFSFYLSLSICIYFCPSAAATPEFSLWRSTKASLMLSCLIVLLHRQMQLKVLSDVCCNAFQLQRLNIHNTEDLEIDFTLTYRLVTGPTSLVFECICAECVFTFRLDDCRGVHECSQTPPGLFRQVLDYDFNCVLNGSWPAEGLKIDIILIRPDCHALPLCGFIQMSGPHYYCIFVFPGSRRVMRAVQTHYSSGPTGSLERTFCRLPESS